MERPTYDTTRNPEVDSVTELRAALDNPEQFMADLARSAKKLVIATLRPALEPYAGSQCRGGEEQL